MTDIEYDVNFKFDLWFGLRPGVGRYLTVGYLHQLSAPAGYDSMSRETTNRWPIRPPQAAPLHGVAQRLEGVAMAEVRRRLGPGRPGRHGRLVRRTGKPIAQIRASRPSGLATTGPPRGMVLTRGRAWSRSESASTRSSALRRSSTYAVARWPSSLAGAAGETGYERVRARLAGSGSRGQWAYRAIPRSSRSV